MKKVTLTLQIPTVKVPKVPKIKKPDVKHHVAKNKTHLAVVGVLLVFTTFMLMTALIIDSQRPKMYHLPDPKKAQAKEQQHVKFTQLNELSQVKEEVKLPKDEQPIFATVSQKEQLQKQAFFKKAQNGDRILLYPKHKKVILYRPSTQKVIAVSKLQYQDDIQPSPTVAVPTETLSPSPVDDITNL